MIHYMHMTGFKPKDLIAIITLSGIIALKYNGIDGDFDTVAALILGYYFAHRANGTDNGH